MIKLLQLVCLALMLPAPSLWAQTISVRGTVKDKKGAPIASASARVKGSKNGTSSDSLGIFHLRVKPFDTLLISAVGYREQAIAVNSRTEIGVELVLQTKSLSEVTVSSPEPRAAMAQEVQKTQAIAGMLHDFAEYQNLYTGLDNTTAIDLTGSITGQRGAITTTIGTATTGTLYRGAFVPVIKNKEETKGSRYLFNEWVRGFVISALDSVIAHNDYLFNYDKINQSLLLTVDKKSAIEIRNEDMKAFALKQGDQLYVFEKWALRHDDKFYRILVKDSGRYVLYKFTTTKFEKSNYSSDGFHETGKPYDEYTDMPEYYILFPDGQTYKTVELKKKAIRVALAGDQKKVDDYFSSHRYANADEALLVDLVKYLNR